MNCAPVRTDSSLTSQVLLPFGASPPHPFFHHVPTVPNASCWLHTLFWSMISVMTASLPSSAPSESTTTRPTSTKRLKLDILTIGV